VGQRIVLSSDRETQIAVASPLLAILAEAGAEVQLRGSSAAFPIQLKDEQQFRAWLDEAKAGKIRVIQRADGFELQTDLGKLPGNDPRGPLRRGLSLLKARFPDALDVCLVPSFGTELWKVAAALSGFYTSANVPLFNSNCLVFPRPH
jgi:hypothetical protein